ncbi:cytochrome P450 [Xylariaceae sp. FL1651]|nr:cytochrome P450 [Xylariaceae sp. FL1651]
MDYIFVPIGLWIVYIIYTVFWRLYLSPIAHIPGPRLAALTLLYEIYYDAWLGGQYTFKIIELHKQYGPIIRISPWELHISDPDFYDTIYPSYSASRRSDKYPYYTRYIGLDFSGFGTVEHDLHHKRRSALQPYFSTASVRRLQPVMQERIDVLLKRMNGFKDTDEVFSATSMFSAFTNDLVSTYCFARCDHRLESQNFDPSARNAARAGVKTIHWLKNAPWINQVMIALPESLTRSLHPAFATFLDQKRTTGTQVQKIMSGENEGWRGTDHPTIFHAILDSKLQPHEKTKERLSDDAQALIMAGTHTTAWTLEVITFWLLNQPETLRKLKEELLTVMPSVDDVGKVPLVTLEGLPYLTAVIKEGLRLSYGVSTRLQRIDPDNAIVFTDRTTGREWVIPPKTPVGMTSVQIHHDESIFTDSDKFIAERWLDNGGKKLGRYLVSFSKGSRNCLGANLAYAKLYLALACIWRLWGSGDVKGSDSVGVLSLFETDLRDVAIAADEHVPATAEGSNGIRLKAHSA